MGTSFVHSCSRIYNLDETPSTEITNTEQTGFNVFFEDKIKNYMIFVGSENLKTFEFEFILNSKINKKIKIEQKYPYELIEVDMSSLFSKKEVSNRVCKLNIKHNLKEEFQDFL